MPFIDDFARNILESLPPEAQALHKNLEKVVQSLIQSALGRLDLVSREEFDVQTAVLQRTREKLMQLEARLDALDTAPSASTDSQSH